MMARGMAINRILDKILKARLLILFVFFHKLSYFDSKGIANTDSIISNMPSICYFFCILHTFAG